MSLQRTTTTTTALLQTCSRCRVQAKAAAAASASAAEGWRFASSQAKKATPALKKKQTIRKASKSGSSGGSGSGESGESKLEGLRKTLYGTDATARRAQDLERAARLQKAIPIPEVHDTIVRAWKVHSDKQKAQQEEEMQARYDCMVEAINQLEKTSPRLFNLATKGPKFSNVRTTKGEEGKKASNAGRIEGLFPRQLPVLR